MKSLLATLALAALVGLMPSPGMDQVQAQTYHQTGTPYYYQQTYQPGTYQPTQFRRRVHFRNIRDDVLQINPAYTQDYNSAYSPGAYDGTVQQQLQLQVQQLQAQIAALTAAAKVTTPVVVVPPSAPGVQPAVVVPPAPAMPYAPPAQPTPVAPPYKPGTNGTRPGLKILQTKCAACHMAGHLSPGQQFTMLDAQGQLTKEALTLAKRHDMEGRVYRKSMPPPNNVFGIPEVTDQEYAAVFDLLH